MRTNFASITLRTEDALAFSRFATDTLVTLTGCLFAGRTAGRCKLPLQQAAVTTVGEAVIKHFLTVGPKNVRLELSKAPWFGVKVFVILGT